MCGNIWIYEQWISESAWSPLLSWRETCCEMRPGATVGSSYDLQDKKMLSWSIKFLNDTVHIYIYLFIFLILHFSLLWLKYLKSFLIKTCQHIKTDLKGFQLFKYFNPVFISRQLCHFLEAPQAHTGVSQLLWLIEPPLGLTLCGASLGIMWNHVRTRII